MWEKYNRLLLRMRRGGFVAFALLLATGQQRTTGGQHRGYRHDQGTQCGVVGSLIHTPQHPTDTIMTRGNWTNKVFVSRTTTTLQVVSNPILDRVFHTPTGPMKNPIHDTAFARSPRLRPTLCDTSRVA